MTSTQNLSLALLACLAGACSGSHSGLRDGADLRDSERADGRDADAAVDEDEDPGRTGGSGGAGAAGDSGSSGGGAAGDGSDTPGAGASGGSAGSAGATAAGGGGEFGGSPGGTAGAGDSDFPGGMDFDDPRSAHEILNPNDCQSDRPFVLTIDPAGHSGSVSGWLESTPVVAFEGQLPRFDSSPGADLALWWSIAGIGADESPSLYFYGENEATRVAVANGASNFDEIDVDALVFDDWVTPEVSPGAIVVFENVRNGTRVALRLDAAYDTDPTFQGQCAGIDASWSFAL